VAPVSIGTAVSSTEEQLGQGAEIAVLPHRLAGLDVARALAASMVLVDHVIAGVLWLPVAGLAESVSRAAAHAARAFGQWGVGLFFVLSGLCIHLPIARRSEQSGWRLEIGPYFRRRFTRIYPPHLVALLLGIAVVAVVPGLVEREQVSLIKPPTLRFFLLHLFMVHTFFADAFASISVVLWTIAIESHFYLLYPVLLWARRRTSMRTICLLLLALSLGVRGLSALLVSSGAVRNTLANSFVCRWWEWALGCYIAEQLLARARGRLVSRTTAGLVLAGSLAVAVGLTDLGRGHLLFAYVTPPVFALALYYAARMVTSANRADQALIKLGHESYSLYLTHPIAISVATIVVLRLGVPWPVAAAVMFAFSLLLSHGFFVMIERPFMARAAATKSRAPSRTS
jgi:peptidoglycan/LPS O-acetylase OafA/YrhL